MDNLAQEVQDNVNAFYVEKYGGLIQQNIRHGGKRRGGSRGSVISDALSVCWNGCRVTRVNDLSGGLDQATVNVFENWMACWGAFIRGTGHLFLRGQ